MGNHCRRRMCESILIMNNININIWWPLLSLFWRVWISVLAFGLPPSAGSTTNSAQFEHSSFPSSIFQAPVTFPSLFSVPCSAVSYRSLLRARGGSSRSDGRDWDSCFRVRLVWGRTWACLPCFAGGWFWFWTFVGGSGWVRIFCRGWRRGCWL